jgi:peptidoglycan/LPS O-acetylase OafA/YrhL
MVQIKQDFYRPEIDGIRAFAIVSVIINHFNKEILPSGYLGVDIFFFISGFVITSSIASRSSKNFGDFILDFYTRRIKRLVPALVVFIFVNSLLICLVNPRPNASLENGIAALVGVANLYLSSQSTDYFAAATELNIFAHTWSLGVEEQFYCLFPLLLWLTGYASMKERRSSKKLFWILAVLSVASLWTFINTYKTNFSTAYFLMPTRLWELGSGCLLFLGSNHANQDFFHQVAKISPAIVIASMMAILLLPSQFAVEATIAVVVATAILTTCLRSATLTYRFFTHPQVVYIGKISYSLYLWHWSVLALSRWTIGIYWWSIPFQIALIVLLAVASYRYVETPLRHAEWSGVHWKSIGYGIGASVVAATLLYALNTIPISLYMGRRPSLVATGVTSLTDPYLLARVNTRWQGTPCVLSDNNQVGKKILVKECTLGHFSSSKKRVLVLGNSFSAAFVRAFDDLVVSDGYSVTITSAWDASPVKNIPNTTAWDRASDYYWASVIPNLLKELKAGDWVFMINDLRDFSPKYVTASTTEHLRQLATGLETFSDQLSAKGIHLAVLHGNPFAREANCTPEIATKQWFHGFNRPCHMPNKRESLLRRDRLNKVLVSLETKRKLRIVDLFDIFCPEQQCTYNARSGQILYRDEFSHPSVEAARLSAPIIRNILTAQ